MNKTGSQLMAEYVFFSKYSQRNEQGDLETWEEVNNRIYSTHRMKLTQDYIMDDHLDKIMRHAQELEDNKVILGSQRARQFAFPDTNAGVLKHETKMYNCSGTLIDRTKVFSEIMYILLSGCGVGYSLHKNHISKLPAVSSKHNGSTKHIIIDSIEGWSDAVDAAITAGYKNMYIDFDADMVRPEGSLINGKFAAPGPDALLKALNNVSKVFQGAVGRKLTSLELHNVICYIAQAVVSGGVRRAACIALFDKDDQEMLTCKTGSWWLENPQYAMANNSILTTYDDTITYKEYKDILNYVKEFGEPGFMLVPSYEWVTNPCGEILMRPKYGKSTGFAFCNLVEINAERVHTEEEFMDACKSASAVGTIQALYTDFKYLSNTTRRIAERDRNIGVSITGVLSNKMMLDKDVLQKGAKLVATVNKNLAARFDIRPARTCTTIKPSGNASTILGLYCSGIHPAHAERYLRRIRVKNTSPEYKALWNTPLITKLNEEESVISFPINTTLRDERPIYKDDIAAAEHLDIIKTLKRYWVNKGCIDNTTNHNVSATVEVREDEWGEVAAALFTNRYTLCGVSLLPKVGDQLYTYAPFTRLYNDEIIAEYKQILDYITDNDVDFEAILSNRAEIESTSMAAMGCSGGACEMK